MNPNATVVIGLVVKFFMEKLCMCLDIYLELGLCNKWDKDVELTVFMKRWRPQQLLVITMWCYHV